MTFKEINAWLVMGVFIWLFADFALPLVQAEKIDGGGDIIGSVIAFIIILVIAHIFVGIIRRKPPELEDERDKLIENRAEQIGGFALGAVVIGAMIYAIHSGDRAYANILFLGLVFSEIAKRAAQVAQYRLGS